MSDTDTTYVAREKVQIIHTKKTGRPSLYDYKIRVKINGKYYIGQLELSE